MSVKIINMVWDTPCKTHTQKLVLVALADNSNDQRICWPGIDYLAKRCDLSRQGVMSQIDALVEQGHLKVKKSDGKVNVYELFPNQSTALTRQPPLPVNAVDDHQSTGLTTPVNGVDPNRKEPPLEPPSNSGASLGGLALKICSWFNRRETTVWADKEVRAYKKILKTSDEDVALLNSYYTAEIKRDEDYRRHDVVTLLNNWPGEIDRAKAFVSTHKQNGSSKSEAYIWGNAKFTAERPPKREMFGSDESFEMVMEQFQRWQKGQSK